MQTTAINESTSCNLEIDVVYVLDHGRLTGKCRGELVEVSEIFIRRRFHEVKKTNQQTTYVAKNTKDFVANNISSLEGHTRMLVVRTFSAINPSAIACEIPTPSLGDVPRPSSSINTRDCGEARPKKKKSIISRSINIFEKRKYLES